MNYIDELIKNQKLLIEKIKELNPEDIESYYKTLYDRANKDNLQLREYSTQLEMDNYQLKKTLKLKEIEIENLRRKL